jgi:hypothetical protein
LFNFEGAGVVAYGCNAGENEEFTFDASKKSLCSVGDAAHAARCLDARAQTPSGGGGGVQIWAKPQPNGATAVLVINSESASCAGVDVDLRAVKFAASASKTAAIKNIWTGASATLAAGATTYTTDAIASHDSRFYLFTPSA